jgi:hypothetical protein
MAKAKSHRGQHHIPATYLSAWCDRDKKPKESPFVWRFALDGTLIARKSPENLFKETDFYTIPMPDGSRNLDLEHGLAELEGNFAIIRKKLANHEILNDGRDLVMLLAFTVAMFFRTKTQRDFQRRQWSRLFDLADSMRKQFADGRTVPPYLRAPVDADATPVDFEALEEMTKRPLQMLLPIAMEACLPIMFSMDIAIVETEADRPGFITSDNPCAWHDPEAITRPPGLRNASLVDKNIEITMPISPRQMLLLNRKGKAGYCTTSATTVDEWNWQRVSWAGEQVIANTSEKRACWFEERPLPANAWENTPRARELAERRKKRTRTS